MKKKRYETEEAKRIQERKQEDSEGSEESKGGLDKFSVRETETCLKKKKHQESIPAGEGSYLKETGQIHNYQRQVWITRDSHQMDKILLRTIRS